jgi:glycopeptide antibiotics resistance protein
VRSRHNRILWLGATCLWAGWLLYMTLTPDNTPNTNRLIPFLGHVRALRCVLTGCPQTTASLRSLFVDLLGNIAVFVPLGVGLSGLLHRPPRRRRVSLALAILGGAFLSLTIESIQFSMPSRAADLTDLLLNSLGTALGAIFFFVKCEP